MMTLNLGGAVSYLRGLMARLHNMQPVMSEIGEHQASRIIQRILQAKEDPEAHAWAAWMPSTLDDRAKKGNVGQGLLWDEGGLLHSIAVQAKAHEVTIGSTSPHAGFLQDGTPRMVARPFMGWVGEDTALAEAQIVKYLEGIA